MERDNVPVTSTNRKLGDVFDLKPWEQTASGFQKIAGMPSISELLSSDVSLEVEFWTGCTRDG
jgi:hypothetical protein